MAFDKIKRDKLSKIIGYLGLSDDLAESQEKNAIASIGRHILDCDGCDVAFFTPRDGTNGGLMARITPCDDHADELDMSSDVSASFTIDRLGTMRRVVIGSRSFRYTPTKVFKHMRSHA